jgi:hypothetical protein
MARPTPADLLILANIAEVLDDAALAREWRRQATRALRPAALRAEVEADRVTGCALLADLSTQFGSLAKVYDLLGPDPAAAPVDGGDEVAMCEPPGDPRRWTR